MESKTKEQIYTHWRGEVDQQTRFSINDATITSMEEYATQQAVEFAEWLLKSKYTKCSEDGVYKGRWVQQGLNRQDFHTTKELYELFNANG